MIRLCFVGNFVIRTKQLNVRTTAEAEGEGLDPVKEVKAPNPLVLLLLYDVRILSLCVLICK